MRGSRLGHAQQPNKRESACYQQELADCDAGEIPLIIALNRPEQGEASGPHCI